MLLAADASWRLVDAVDALADASRSQSSPSAVARVAVSPCEWLQSGPARAALDTASALARPTLRAIMQLSVGGEPLSAGALTAELFGHVAPQTVENFARLCRGDPSGQRTYVEKRFHRIIRGFMAQGGSDGHSYGESAFGGQFSDETFALSHDGAGVLSMANAGENTNGAQFFILFGAQPHLDGKHVVFGRLVRDDGGASMMALREMENLGSASGATSKDVRIASCTTKAIQ